MGLVILLHGKCKMKGLICTSHNLAGKSISQFSIDENTSALRFSTGRPIMIIFFFSTKSRGFFLF